MCKSKDAVIASYHWAVLHTPVDTRAMYYVSSLLPLFVSRTFRYGRGERQDCKKKDCKGDRVGVFQWLARLAHLARMARMACTFGSLARWLTHWPHSLYALYFPNGVLNTNEHSQCEEQKQHYIMNEP